MRARDKDAPPLGCGHPVTWLSYAYLQQGRFADARRLIDGCGEEMRSHPFMPEHEMGPQSALDSDSSSAASFAVMRSRYLIDSGDWSGPVAAMKVNVENLITAEFTRDWADAYGAVRFGKLDAAVAAIERAKEFHEALCRCGHVQQASRPTHPAQRMAEDRATATRRPAAAEARPHE